METSYGPTACTHYHECRALRTALNTTKSYQELADFHKETLQNIHASNETAHIVNRVPGTPGVNGLSEMPSATNARGWDIMAGYVASNLKTGPSRPKAIPVKATHEAWDCMPEYTSSY